MGLEDKAQAHLLEDPPSQVGLLHGFDSFLHNFCPTCELWLGNPLQHLQSFVGASGRVKPISLIRSVARWNTGGQSGCVLCQIVSLASARMRESREASPVSVAKFIVTPIRDDFPHRITLSGLDSEMDESGK